MPGPFPGIDPYLESQGRWTDFHASFITYCRDALLDRLPENYEAVIDEQFELYELREEESRKTVKPDVALVRSRPSDGGRRADRAGTAVLEPVTVPVAMADTLELRHTWIEVRGLPDRALVAVIKVLSPTNKSGMGRGEYLRKRDACIRQPVHLIELDFLLAGRRPPMGGPLPPGDFYAIVARAERMPDADVYAWSIRQPLPLLPIPLRAPDPDVILDLSEVYATAHDRGRYARRLDYQAPLNVPLTDADRTWAEELARSATK